MLQKALKKAGSALRFSEHMPGAAGVEFARHSTIGLCHPRTAGPSREHRAGFQAISRRGFPGAFLPEPEKP